MRRSTTYREALADLRAGRGVMPRRATVVMAGGGAKGQLEQAAERVLREEGGFLWDSALGVSVGALNSLLVAQGRYGVLRQVWQSVTAEQVYRRYSVPEVLWRIAAGKDGIYHNRPLRELIRQAAEGHKLVIPCWVGRVNLDTGAYELVGRAAGEKADAEFCDAVWHSATMPVLWESVAGHADGGVKNVTPLGDALRVAPCREVVVILCNPVTPIQPRPLPAKRHIWDTALRVLEMMETEIGTDDLQQFLRLNDLVKQAEAKGVRLRKPDGNTYRHVPITIVAPTEDPGPTVDFGAAWRAKRVDMGEAMARTALTLSEAA